MNVLRQRRDRKMLGGAIVRMGLLCVGLAACGDSVCVTPPCPQTFPIKLTLTSAASGAPVNGTVTIQGGSPTPFPCNGTCEVPGPAGTYELDIAAPGFQSVHRTVQVGGTNVKCGCSTVETQQVAIALVPSA